MGQRLHFQHCFWHVIQEVTYHCILTIISVGVILCNKQNFIGKRAAIYVEIIK